ncbi:ribonuclease H-like domain-containing protein [Tanacetum coccineum]
MACSVSYTDDEIKALVQKLIDEDIVRQKAILDLALQFDNACTAKDDLRKAYEKCNDISQESRALIDTFLKEICDKDYEMNLSMYGKTAKIEKQMNAKLVWLREKYNYRSQTHMGDEEALRETLEEETKTEKELEERIRQKQDDNELFMLEFEVSATNYVIANGGIVSGCLGDIKNFLNNGKLDQFVAIVKSCSPNVIGDLTVTMKDLSGTIPGIIHHKVVDEGGYGKDITVGSVLLLANVLVFSLKPSMHYLNIIMRNMVKVFRKDTVPGSGNG